jgi:hypothetical protein
MKIVYKSIGTDICKISDEYLYNNYGEYGSEYISCNLGFYSDGIPAFFLESGSPEIVGNEENIGLWSDMAGKIRLDSSDGFENDDSLVDSITPSSSSISVGSSVSFTAALGSSVDASNIEMYYWSFGDGTTVLSKTPALQKTHSYPEIGNAVYSFGVITNDMRYDLDTGSIAVTAHANEDSCTANSQCQSLSCCSGVCKGGACLGATCTANNQCYSQSCCNGICSATACISDIANGDPCTANSQCLSKSCCSSVCSATQCTTGIANGDPCTANSQCSGQFCCREVCSDKKCPQYVFVTTGTLSGNMFGTSIADSRCAVEAASVPRFRGQKFVAWLSTSTLNAKDRINDTEYRLVNETVIALNINDLTKGTLQNPINKDILGNTAKGIVWTGTKSDGIKTTQNCASWTSSLRRNTGVTGLIDKKNSSWTNNTLNTGCDSRAKIYCFEVSAPPQTQVPSP